MSNTSWGTNVWVFLHSLVSKINHKKFPENKNMLIEIIFKICSNLPCPECSQHSIEFLKTIHFNNVTKKEDLIEILFVFHNQVNKNLNKMEFPEKLLENYKNNNINTVLNNFITSFNIKTNVPSLMTQSFIRRTITKDIKSYIENNLSIFE